MNNSYRGFLVRRAIGTLARLRSAFREERRFRRHRGAEDEGAAAPVEVQRGPQLGCKNREAAEAERMRRCAQDVDDKRFLGGAIVHWDSATVRGVGEQRV